MRRLSYFLMVGLAFTVLQISTVSAEDVDISHCADLEPTAARPACEAAAHAGPPMGDPNMPPPGGHHDGPDCAALPTPGEVAACWDAKAKHDGPPPGMPHDGPPPGGHHDGPPPGAVSYTHLTLPTKRIV